MFFDGVNMDRRTMIVIGAVICIVAAVTVIILATNVNYERIEITPNGTSIDIPDNQLKYVGDIGGVKVWKWNKGALVTYNSQENLQAIELTESLGFNALRQLVKNGDAENIEGFTFYSVDAGDLFDIVKVANSGKFYCTVLDNETTHDNIFICCNDRNVALHMAKSVDYVPVNITSGGGNSDIIAKVNSTIGDALDNYSIDDLMDAGRKLI